MKMEENNYPRDINFICPSCGAKVLHEERVIIQTRVVRRISALGAEHFGVSYDGDFRVDKNMYDEPIFRCANCKTQIAYGECELDEWLTARGMALQWFTPEWRLWMSNENSD